MCTSRGCRPPSWEAPTRRPNGCRPTETRQHPAWPLGRMLLRCRDVNIQVCVDAAGDGCLEHRLLRGDTQQCVPRSFCRDNGHLAPGPRRVRPGGKATQSNLPGLGKNAPISPRRIGGARRPRAVSELGGKKVDEHATTGDASRRLGWALTPALKSIPAKPWQPAATEWRTPHEIHRVRGRTTADETPRPAVLEPAAARGGDGWSVMSIRAAGTLAVRGSASHGANQ